ncbi:MAG: hypothetical protein ACYCT1_10845 [Steroidobacteraceae bacterium]
MTDPTAPSDLTRALVDPASIFDAPEAVLRSAGLSRVQKLEILCRWAYDASELAVAEEEGMAGGEASQLDAVMTALNELTHGFDAERVAPTKHGAVCLAEQADDSDAEPGQFASSPCYMHEVSRHQ